MELKDLLNPLAAIADSVCGALTAWFKTDDDKAQGRTAVMLALQQAGAVQAMVTMAEVQSDDKFKSRWRPALGWMCVAGLSLHYVVFPVVQSIVIIWAPDWTQPTIDANGLIAMVGTLLGLGAMRTVEKIQGKS